MFGLDEAQYNVVKRAARNLNEAISALPKADRKKEAVVIEVIDKHHKPVELLINRMRFVWVAGYIAGRVGNKTGDYE